jgi:WD40 repeat protein
VNAKTSHISHVIKKLIAGDLQFAGVSTSTSRALATMTIGNVGQLRPIGLLKGHNGLVTSVCWSPDGKLLATTSDDKTAIIWDVNATMQPLTPTSRSLPASIVDTITLEEGARAASWSADGRTLAITGGDGGVCLWDRSTMRTVAFSPSDDGRPADTPHALPPPLHSDATAGRPAGGAVGAGFSPDGRLLVVPRCEEVWVMDVEGRRWAGVLRGHAGRVRGAAFSPDGGLVASASEDGTGRVWGIDDAEEAREAGGGLSRDGGWEWGFNI